MDTNKQAHDELPFEGGVFTIEVIRDGKNGPEVIERRVSHNLITSIGKKHIMRKAAGLFSTYAFDQMRIGTSGAAAASNQTNVLSPVTGTLETIGSITASGRTLQLVHSYASGAGSKSATGIEEVCILSQNTSPGGSAMARAVFTAVNKTAQDKLKITYTARIT